MLGTVSIYATAGRMHAFLDKLSTLQDEELGEVVLREARKKINEFVVLAIVHCVIPSVCRNKSGDTGVLYGVVWRLWDGCRDYLDRHFDRLSSDERNIFMEIMHLFARLMDRLRYLHAKALQRQKTELVFVEGL